MSKINGNLPRKFFSFRHLGCKSSAHKVPEERESKNPQNVEEVVGTSFAEVGETSNSPAKVMSVLQNAPVSSGVGISEEVEKDHELTVAEKDCVMTSSEEDMDDLTAFVNEKLQFMSEQGLEQLVQLFIVSDRQLQVSGNDSPFFIVSGSVSCQLQDFSSQVLQHSIKGRLGHQLQLVQRSFFCGCIGGFVQRGTADPLGLIVSLRILLQLCRSLIFLLCQTLSSCLFVFVDSVSA